MKKSLLYFLLLLPFFGMAQQDANFSQYIFNTIYINPAYAGYKNNLYIQSNYRKQWVGVDGAPTSFSFAADAAMANEKVGLSLLVNADKIGAQNSIGVYGGYAYHLNMGTYTENKLSFGFNLGFLQTSINGKLLDPNDNGDDFIPLASESSFLPDARAGILYSSESFFAGISASNILSNFSIGKKKSDWYVGLKPHLYLLGGLILHPSEDVVIKPMFLLKDDFGGPTNLDLNGFILLNEKVWLGAMYRTAVKLYDKSHLQKDLTKMSSAGALLEFFATPKLRIGYSFDYALNRLRNQNNGTHEISIGFYLRENNNNRQIRTWGCYL